MREMNGTPEAAGLGRCGSGEHLAASDAEAVRKARQEIRKLRRAHRTAHADRHWLRRADRARDFAAMPEVDRVIRQHAKKMQPETWAGMAADFVGNTEKRCRVDDIIVVTETAGHLIDGFGTPGSRRLLCQV